MREKAPASKRPLGTYMQEPFSVTGQTKGANLRDHRFAIDSYKALTGSFESLFCVKPQIGTVQPANRYS
ncbi:hypothetical protein GGR93_003898 [Sulfitobacter noctilucicola]|uniref:Uncharacterized protein n=1 Tax=Sulfitobacter noctilucicola TaxID=1342301 RepID=A0A7W6Q575_9RHOB|nr:hypothetical protein [Sulfitobacter noctilucicola]